MKLEFSQQVFKKYSNAKFHEDPFSWNDEIACIRSKGHDGQT